jgi:peptidase E
MSAERPALLLAGGRPRDPSGTIRTLSRALQECLVQKPKVAYIGTASGDSVIFFNMIKSLLKKAGAAEVSLVRLAKEGADASAAKRTLERSDIIFISGGEVEDGMQWLERHDLVGFLKDLYRRGKLFLGMSAGSIMMGAHWVHWDDETDDNTASLFDCLNLIPCVFDTHAEDEDWKELKTALRLMGPGARGYGIPRDGMISADSGGNLVNMEKELLVYVNRDGTIEQE